MNSPVQQIKERLGIEEVVSSYLKLDRAGKNLKAKCPFHNEKTPSFFVSPDRQSYYCFGCSAKGDIFTFVQEFEGLDFRGALKVLAERAGVTLGVFNREIEGEKEKLYRIMEEATRFFEKNLAQNKEAQEYLKSRGLADQTIKDFRVGFAQSGWRLLLSHLKSRGFADTEIEKAGLIKKPDQIMSGGEHGFYDRFRGRIIFPIADSSGRIIAFSGRILVSASSADGDDGKSAKYLNSPETPIFSKSAVLYGLDRAKDSIRKNNFSILVEGQLDLILSHQAGFKNTVATSGTALSDSTVSKENVVSNLGLLRRLSGNIVLAFDADRAGLGASRRAGSIALSLGMDVKVVSMREGVDPADLIAKDGPEAWRAAVRNSRHIIEFLLDKVLDSCQGDAHKVAREIREKVLPYVSFIENSIEKANFVKKISNLSGVREDALIEELAKVARELEHDRGEASVRLGPASVPDSGKTEHPPAVLLRMDYIERRLLGVILWQRSLKDRAIDVEAVVKEFSSILNIAESELLSRAPSDRADLIFEAEVFYDEDVDLRKDVAELLVNLREEHLRDALARKMQDLRNFELEENSNRSNQVLREISEINRKIQEIKEGRLNK